MASFDEMIMVKWEEDGMRRMGVGYLAEQHVRSTSSASPGALLLLPPQSGGLCGSRTCNSPHFSMYSRR